MKALKIIGIVLLVLVAAVFMFAKVNRITPLSMAHDEVNQPMFSSQAINGYDAVAYFNEKQAKEGKEEYTHVWNDAEWFFSSEANMKLFAEKPEKYVPEYGGFCAFAVSKGFTADTDPKSFEIIDGKLYLFSEDKVKSEWISNKVENLKLCEANWN